jgi:hypothetical protein
MNLAFDHLNKSYGLCMSKIIIFLTLIFISIKPCYARECKILDTEWSEFCIVLQKRTAQTQAKMKLSEAEATEFEKFLLTSKLVFTNCQELKNYLPKTTLELMRAVAFRDVDIKDAEVIAKYLKNMVVNFNFQNIGAFDENTSHIIGRDWHEIDYSGEGMTWEKQKEKYKKYAITNFKTIENIKLFFPVESKLPYFKKIYRPLNTNYQP